MTFQEMARRGKELLDKQKPVTFEEAKAQVEMLRKNSKCRNTSLAHWGRASLLQSEGKSSNL